MSRTRWGVPSVLCALILFGCQNKATLRHASLLVKQLYEASDADFIDVQRSAERAVAEVANTDIRQNLSGCLLTIEISHTQAHLLSFAYLESERAKDKTAADITTAEAKLSKQKEATQKAINEAARCAWEVRDLGN